MNLCLKRLEKQETNMQQVKKLWTSSLVKYLNSIHSCVSLKRLCTLFIKFLFISLEECLINLSRLTFKVKDVTNLSLIKNKM